MSEEQATNKLSRSVLRRRVRRALTLTDITEMRAVLEEVDQYLRQAISVNEAGKLGGNALRDLHGVEHFRRIGKKGGETTASTYGTEFYQRIGREGGKRSHSES